MKAKIEVKLKPFILPNYVLTEEEATSQEVCFKESRKVLLRELDVEILDYLCNKFRDEIFEKAGKSQPTRQAGQRKPPFKQTEYRHTGGIMSELIDKLKAAGIKAEIDDSGMNFMLNF